MADQENIPAKNVSADEDTRTRRTVRLQTVVPAATGPALDDAAIKAEKVAPATPAAPAAPAADTRTRLTVKLKPVVPGAAPAAVPGTAAAAPAAPEADSAAEEDTRTRITVRLKPAVSAAAAVPIEPAVKAAAPSEPDTRTRNTVKVKPMAAAQQSAPAIAGNEEKAGEAPVEAADDDRTVRIQRPVLKKPMPPRSISMPKPPAVPAPAAEAAPAAAAPVNSAPVAAAEVPALQKTETPAPVSTPAAAPVSEPEAVTGEKLDNAVEIQSVPVSGSRPSVLYMILTLITFVLLAGAATLGVVHYLNFEQKMDIELPGIPFEK